MDEEVIISIRKSRGNGRIFVVIADDNMDTNRKYLTSNGIITTHWGGSVDYFLSYDAALKEVQSKFIILGEAILDESVDALIASPED